MSRPELVEGMDCLKVRSQVRVWERILIATFGLFPLFAPYQLIKTDWEHFMNPSFQDALILAVAMFLSAALFRHSVVVLSSELVFDRCTATFSYSSEAPVVRRTTQVHPLRDIRRVETGVQYRHNRAPTYHLMIIVKDGVVFKSDSSRSRDQIKWIRNRVDQFLAAVNE